MESQPPASNPVSTVEAEAGSSAHPGPARDPRPDEFGVPGMGGLPPTVGRTKPKRELEEVEDPENLHPGLRHPRPPLWSPTPSPHRTPPRAPPSSPGRRSLGRKCSGKGRGCLHVLHMIWFDIIFLLLVLGIAGACLRWMPIFMIEHRLFPVRYDEHSKSWKGPESLSRPVFHREKKSIHLPGEFIVPVMKFSLALPIVVGLALLFMQIWVRSAWDKLSALMGLYKALAFVALVQTVLKNFIGKFRPNFMERCNPDWENIMKFENLKWSEENTSQTNGNMTIISNQIWISVKGCKTWSHYGPTKKLKGAMQSFPSGHTCECFAAAAFLALYLNAKLKPFSDFHTGFWKMAVVIAPLFAACFVGGSLIVDGNHHAHDVLLSIPIGISIALAAYRSHYASLFNYHTNHLHLPWSGSHRSLDLSPQRSIDPLSSRPRNSRFRYYDNLTAVAWPRKPIKHEFGQVASPVKERVENPQTFDGAADDDGDEQVTNYDTPETITSEGMSNPKLRTLRGLPNARYRENEEPSPTSVDRAFQERVRDRPDVGAPGLVSFPFDLHWRLWPITAIRRHRRNLERKEILARREALKATKGKDVDRGQDAEDADDAEVGSEESEHSPSNRGRLSESEMV